MTNLYDGQVADLLQNSGKYNPEIRALSFAVLQEKRRIMDLADKTRTMAMIDTLPEAVLDILAVELRTPAYSVDLPIDTKRTLIKGTLTYYKKLGTPEAVNWVIRAVFGNGEIQEWFDYGGEPGYFRVKTENVSAVWGNLDNFLSTVEKVKRLSSHLEKVVAIQNTRSGLGVGLASQRFIRRTISMSADTSACRASYFLDEAGGILTDEFGDILID